MPAKVDPGRISAAFAQAQGLLTAGRRAEALAAFRAVLALSPGLPEAEFQIARIHFAEKRFPEARVALEAALKVRPQEPALWAARVDLARTDPGSGPVAAILARARKAGLAPAELDRLAAADPATDPEPPAPPVVVPFLKRADAARAAGDEAGAARQLDRAAEAAPGTAQVLIRRAEVRKTLGDLAGGLADAAAAVQAAPQVGGYWRTWATTGKVNPGDPLLDALRARHAAAPRGSEPRRQMAFALAKAMEDIGAHDQVFAFLDEANALTARRFPYNPQADMDQAARLRRGWSADLAARWTGTGHDGAAPIFVTGLPRTGTTLVEQMLAAHPDVAGGGETGLIFGPLARIGAAAAEHGPEAGAALAEAGRVYAREMARRHPRAARITDKSIATYAVLGYVTLALPRAKAVVVRRDPRDVGLSIYKTAFADGQHRYSYSQEGIAAFLRMFETQVAFWREVLPQGAFLELWYEDVVADPQGQARRLLDFCGLPWNDRVLDFHKADRAIRTLSVAQVRQPLYASSVGAWRRHEAEMAPFLRALGPVSPR